MSWHPAIPPMVEDPQGRNWQVRRAWAEATAGSYVLELVAPDGPGVRAAHLRDGQLELLRYGRDPRLRALAPVSSLGEVVVHRAHMRAVVRGRRPVLQNFSASPVGKLPGPPFAGG